MFSKIFLNSKNLISNINLLEQDAKMPLCVMVKANAYGHGSREIVSILNNRIKHFGVSNLQEALEIRDYTKDEIIVFGKCDDYQQCIENDISFILLSYNQAKDIVALSKKLKKRAKMHLCMATRIKRNFLRL